MRFAYLILAHNNFFVLDRLVRMLDDPRNDIFIHFDSKLKQLPEIKVKDAGLFIVSDRIDVRWGTISQIKALYKLFYASYTQGSYDLYFVISGTHLPLKDQDFIHDYFAKHQGNTIIRKWPEDEGETDFKMRRYHFFVDNLQSPVQIRKAIVQKLWNGCLFFQKRLGIKRYRDKLFTKADEWAVISAGHIQYLLEHKNEILRKYRHSFCCDEFYLASELMAYDKKHIIDDQNLLFVKFNKESPFELSHGDYVKLLKSSFIFARKFSDKSINQVL